MATRKKTTAPAAKTTTALATTDWLNELAAHATEASEQMASAGGSSFISTKGGRFTYNDAELPMPLNVVILGSIRENNYYEGDYDPDNPASPVCFAVADPELPPKDQEAAMRPHETAPSPQAETCAACEMNKFGTALRGKGKACKNTVRLALLSAEPYGDEAMAAAEPALMRLPVTSLKGFKGYVDKLKNVLNRPPFGVVTALDAEPDNKDQYHVTFELAEKVDDGAIGAAIMLQRKAALPALTEPPRPRDSVEEEAAPARPASRDKRRGGAKAPPAPKRVGAAAGKKAKAKF